MIVLYTDHRYHIPHVTFSESTARSLPFFGASVDQDETNIPVVDQDVVNAHAP